MNKFDKQRPTLLFTMGVASKADLTKLIYDEIGENERALRELHAGRGEPGDSIDHRERELEKCLEALAEVNRLPDAGNERRMKVEELDEDEWGSSDRGDEEE